MQKKVLLLAVSVAVISVFVLTATSSGVELQWPGETYTPSTSPNQVHLTWQTNDTAHTMTVIWRTSSPDTGDIVKYDTVSRDGVVADYEYEATGTHHTFEVDVPEETAERTGVRYGLNPAWFFPEWPYHYEFEGYIHVVELTGLEPDTTYYFICGGPGGWSQEWSFRTAPAASKDIVFAMGGDSRSPYGGEIRSHPERVSNFPWGRNWVSEEMAANEPLFTIYTGDMVERGEYPGHWNSWMNHQQEYWVTENDRMIPIVPVVGNHEVLTEMFPLAGWEYGKENSPFYYEQFALPGNERWYSLDFGPDLHVVVLDSEVPREELSIQASWLEEDLRATDAKWIVVAFHRPIYSSGDHGSDLKLREYWEPILEDYGVDLVITGHDHDYERSYPIKDGKVSSRAEGGVVHVVNGVWGAPTYPIEETNWWTAKAIDMRHLFSLAELSAAEETLNLKAIDSAGRVLDNVTYSSRVRRPVVPLKPLEVNPPEVAVEPGEHVKVTLRASTEPGDLIVPAVTTSSMYDTSLKWNQWKASPAEWTFEVWAPEAAAGKSINAYFNLYSLEDLLEGRFTPRSQNYITLHVVEGPNAHLTFLGTNDFEGFARPSWPHFNLGGSPYMKSYFDAIEKSNPGGVLEFDAGDVIGAAPLFSGAFEGASVIDLYNEMGYDAMAIGNHEFDWGKDVLENRISEAGFPMLAANIYDAATGRRPYRATAMFEMKGIDIGVIGLCYPGSPEITVPEFVEGLKFTDGVSEVNNLADELEAKGADFIIVLAHYGTQRDVDYLTSRIDSRQVELIFDGHAGPKRARVSNDILCSKADHKGRGFARADFTINVATGGIIDRSIELVPVEHEVVYEGENMTPDPEIESKVVKYEEEVEEISSEVIGEATEPITRDYWHLSELGDMVTDSTVWYFNEKIGVPVDFAVQNPGGLRADIDEGDITYGEAYSALPFPNYYVVAEMTGAEVEQLIEDGMNDYGHIQVSGLDFTVNWSKPYGDRVSDLRIHATGEPIDPEVTYYVAANNFIAAGGDRYTELTEVPQVPYYGIAYRDPLVAWVRANIPVTPIIEENITIIGTHPG